MNHPLPRTTGAPLPLRERGWGEGCAAIRYPIAHNPLSPALSREGRGSNTGNA
jgi:hypothetical protein